MTNENLPQVRTPAEREAHAKAVRQNPLPLLDAAGQAEAESTYLRMFSWLNQLEVAREQGLHLVSRGTSRLETMVDGKLTLELIPTAWLATGWHVNSSPEGKRLYVKLGNEPYQPVGWVNDTQLVLSDICKPLFKREFAYMRPEIVDAPFKAEEIPVPEAFKLEIERETQRLETQIKEVDELSMAYFKAKGRNDTRTKHLYEDLLAGIHLASMQLPKLQEVLDYMVSEKPEVGKDLRGADPVELAGSVVMWMKQRKDHLQIELSQTKLQLVPQEMIHPAELLLKEARDAQTEEAKIQVLKRIWLTFPLTKPTAQEVDFDPSWESATSFLEQLVRPKT